MGKYRSKYFIKSIDRRLVNELMTDPTRTLTELGVKVGICASKAGAAGAFVRNKIKNYKHFGLIKKEYTVFNEEDFGYVISKEILVSLADKKDMTFFEDSMSIKKEVRKVSLVRGEYDYILSTLYRTESEYEEFREYLINMDVCRKIQTINLDKTVFEKTQFPTIF